MIQSSDLFHKYKRGLDLNKYLILPGCDDTNRGDQALIWETVRLAEDAGYIGQYYMIATEKCSLQSKKIGIEKMDYILPHPSDKVFEANNRKYSTRLKFKWAKAVLGDTIVGCFLLNKFFRRIIGKHVNDSKKETLKLFENADAAFVKGGGFLHAYGGFVDSYKIFFFLFHIKLALSMGIQVYVMPNSFGPLKSPFSRRMVQRVLRKCKIVTCRESISRDFLNRECSISSILTNDLAMYLEKDPKFDAKSHLQAAGIPITSQNCVAITLRPYRFPRERDGEEKYNKYKQAIADFVVWLSENRYYPVFVEHVFSENSHERDMCCIEEVVSLLPQQTVYAVFSDLDLNCRQMKSIYSCFDYTVGTRFHSVIFSLSEEVPSIAITYGGNKGQGIMNDLGISNYSVPISDVTSNWLKEAFQSLCDNKEALKDRLHSGKQAVQAERNELIKLLRDKFDKS